MDQVLDAILVQLASHEIEGGVHGALLDLAAVAGERHALGPDARRGGVAEIDGADGVGFGAAAGDSESLPVARASGLFARRKMYRLWPLS